MNPEIVFSIVNAMIMPQWVLMIFAPHGKWTQKLVDSYMIPLLLAVAYAFYLIKNFGNLDFMSFSTLAGVKALFSEEQSILIGWIHYLCFDLVAGTWIYKDSLNKSINRVLTGVCLLFCMMLGPIGFLMYWIIRRLTKTNAR